MQMFFPVINFVAGDILVLLLLVVVPFVVILLQGECEIFDAVGESGAFSSKSFNFPGRAVNACAKHRGPNEFDPVCSVID